MRNNGLWVVGLWTIICLCFYGVGIEANSSLNFEWGDVVVYGQPGFYSNNDSLISTPYDFLVTKGTLLVLSFNLNQVVEFKLTNPNLWAPHFIVSGYLLHSIAATDTYYYFGTGSSLIRVLKDFTNYTYIFASGNPLVGLLYNNGSLYVSNKDCCRVSVFDQPEITSIPPRVIYGQPNQTSVSYLPGPTLTYFADKTVMDCSGTLLWVSDPNNGRVVAYPIVENGSSYTPRIVLGQRNDSTKSASNKDANTLDKPRGVAFNHDCSVMFVADSFRVLRYRAPFSTGQAAEGVLGFSSFSEDFYNLAVEYTTESTFYNLHAIHFDDYRNGTGKLYILDQGNNRVLAGITSTTLPLTYPLYCNQPNSTNICSIKGALNIANNQTLALQQLPQLYVQGNITLNPLSSVNVVEGQTIISSGAVTLAGVLILTVNSDARNITVFEHGGSQGEFSSIQIIDNDEKKDGCVKEGRGEYRATGMSVIISEICSGGDDTGGGVDKRVVIGVVVGVGGCIVIMILAGVIIGLVTVWIRNSKSKSSVAHV